MRRLWRFVLVLLILLSCVSCDRATKNIAKEQLAASPAISLLNDAVRFEYTENSGALLGLGSTLPSGVRYLLLVVFAGASLLFTLIYIASARRLDFALLMGLSLVAGGGLGNLIDRIFNNGFVTDFVRLRAGPLRTGIFNMADVAIVVGTGLILLWSLREGKEVAETT
jgi:signal peptidase II